MAQAFGVANKCLIPVAGVPMLKRVAGAVRQSGLATRTVVSIEDPEMARELLGDRALVVQSAESAPGSVLAAFSERAVTFPLLITTGDHALLTPAMVSHFCAEAEKSGADFCAGLATAETILAAYPQSVRTFFTFGADRVSGCNLFALNSEKALALIARWQYLEQVRKKPWRLVAAFGLAPLVQFLLGRSRASCISLPSP
jgi:GTP:adenosylcobinamide-phosphate guanylyltransferase